MYGTTKIAGTENYEIATFGGGAASGPEFNPKDMFRADQQFTPIAQDNPYVLYQEKKIYTSYVWPIGEIVNEQEWLEQALEATNAVGVAVLLFIYHKQHKYMDYVPLYLSNPAFMTEHGDQLKATLSKFMSGNVRNDVLYRYQRLLQVHPIMFDTMNWLDEFHQDQIGSKLYRFGIPDAFPFIKPENVTVEMIHEAILNAKVNAAKRLVPPATPQFIEMYVQLLQHGGSDQVDVTELVNIALMDWKLAYSYIKAKELDFNTALSILMTFVYKRGTDVAPYDNFVIIEKLFKDHGPSNQWPTLDNVVRHVNVVTGGRVGTSSPLTNLHPDSYQQNQNQHTSPYRTPSTNRSTFE